MTDFLKFGSHITDRSLFKCRGGGGGLKSRGGGHVNFHVASRGGGRH